MQTYDYRKDKNIKDDPSENSGEETDFDVDQVFKRVAKGIKGNQPNSAEGWVKKFESEDEYIRNKNN